MSDNSFVIRLKVKLFISTVLLKKKFACFSFVRRSERQIDNVFPHRANNNKIEFTLICSITFLAILFLQIDWFCCVKKFHCRWFFHLVVKISWSFHIFLHFSNEFLIKSMFLPCYFSCLFLPLICVLLAKPKIDSQLTSFSAALEMFAARVGMHQYGRTGYRSDWVSSPTGYWSDWVSSPTGYRSDWVPSSDWYPVRLGDRSDWHPVRLGLLYL